MTIENDDTPVEHRRDDGVDLDAIDMDFRSRVADSEVTRYVPILIAEVRRLRERQQANLATIVKLSQTVPFDDEVKNALEQRGKMLSEIGTLKARCVELESALADVLTTSSQRIAELELLVVAHNLNNGAAKS